MKTKICGGKCRLEKLIEEFSLKKGKPQSYCKECSAEYKNEHYRNNKDNYQSNTNAYKRTRRKFIWEIKEKSKCSECSESHPACLDFHHKDGDKEFNIGNGDSYSKKTLLKEIQKCIILCTNCHRKLHFNEKKCL